jgi:hypothetical protein
MFKKALFLFIFILCGAAFLNVKTAHMANLYFSAVDGNGWGNPTNWCYDPGCLDPANTTPASEDDVYVGESITGEGSSYSVGSIVVSGGASLEDITLSVSNGANFNDSFNVGTIEGNISFYNGSNEGVVNGEASFNGYGGNIGTVNGNANFYSSSMNEGSITGDADFYNDSSNLLTVNGNAKFFNNSYNGGDVLLSAFFYGESFNEAYITDASFNDSSYNSEGGSINGVNISFNDNSYNNGGVNNSYGGTEFNNYSYNNGTITANTVFNNYSYNNGTINGNATFKDASNNLSVVTGTISNLQTAAVIYFGGVNGEWNNVANWYDNFNLTTPAQRLPNPNDDVVIRKNVTGNTGVNPTIKNLTISNSFYLEGVTINVVNNATFNNDSFNRGIIIGDVIFNNSTYNQGTTTGEIIFYDTSENKNFINGAAIFNSASTNSGTITGNATFNNVGRNSGTVIGDATFNNYRISYNREVLNSYASNQGVITGTAKFTNATSGVITLVWQGAWGNGTAAYYIGADNSPITKWVFSNNSVNQGVITGEATFNDSSENQGTINGVKTRVYKSNISINRNFVDDGPWTVVADGAIVNIYRSNYNSSTTLQTKNGGSFITTPQSAPDSNGLIITTPSIPQVAITDSSLAVLVTINKETTNPTLDVSSMIIDGSGLLPAMTIDAPGLKNFQVRIASSTKVTSSNMNWNGILIAPTMTTTTLPTTEGLVRTLVSSIKIGYFGDTLSFDKGVRLIFPDQAGEKIGYSNNGNEFVEINNVCLSDDQADADILASNSECKINVGSDLVVWTKHFTTFAVFTEEKATSMSFGGAPVSTRDAYAEWLAQKNNDNNISVTETKNNLVISTSVATIVEKISQEAIEIVGVKADDRANNFINNGTFTTNKLGKGERSGVIDSFKSSFGRNPNTETDWQDIVKIANGRWPSQKALKTEKLAERDFKKIYNRAPDRKNAFDDTAVVVMSYGLRPVNRNINSEKEAIKSFQYIFKHKPVNAIDWDVVRAIAYSGAKK